MGEKIGEVDMKYIDQARKERRFLYVDWNTGSVMLSNVSQGGGKRLSDEEIEERKKYNKSISEKRKSIRKEINAFNKDIIDYAKSGNFDKAKRASEKIKELEKQLKSKEFKRKPIPLRARKKK